ncbi:SMP-30/gluconolactonase/LRE family protein [bacterium]|nr:SMP-30/gluconolactonase/LRE family protein [bacterium]
MLPSSIPKPDLPQNAPKGEVKELQFSDSKIFPGTVRGVWVFIPAQYDGSKPACVCMKTDGYSPQIKPLLEGLIAGGYMPVTVGVFVKPGELPAPGMDTRGRRNRCLEYDAMGDNNARFLIEEILPFVARELNLNLSTSGNDRSISGGSSGGITAFNAAWERPDAFTRIYANSGSFVAFRGGNEFPTLVRKFEAKPIRAYLTTGTHDMENCAGDWFLNDLEMDKALKFSGYDYMFRTLEGPHVVGFYECFPEAMAFIWKGWPKPVPTGPSAPRVQDIILPGESWQLLAEGYRDARGPACNATGEVYFADSPNDKVYRIGLDGGVSEFVSASGHANDLTVGPQGEVYTVSSQSGRILQYTPAGEGSLVIDGVPGHSIMATPQGGLYVTSPGERRDDPSKVWFIQDGKKTLVDSGLKHATGLAYRPDQWLLSVADGGSKWVYSYQINPDGSLANKERFFWLLVPDWEDDAGAESVCYASEGQMFVATRFGIQVCADDGPTQVVLPMPDHSRVVGVCLGGPEGDTLFAFCGDRIWKRKVKTHAIGAFSPWVKVAGSRR